MVTKPELTEGYQKSMDLYVESARTVIVGTVLMAGASKKKAVEIALRNDTADLVAKHMKELVDHVIACGKEVNDAGI
ncbi:MAG: hypothetical protein ACYTBJ_00790 [Planctomycetota bacterium]